MEVIKPLVQAVDLEMSVDDVIEGLFCTPPSKRRRLPTKTPGDMKSTTLVDMQITPEEKRSPLQPGGKTNIEIDYDKIAIVIGNGKLPSPIVSEYAAMTDKFAKEKTKN